MKTKALIICFLALGAFSFQPDKPAYMIYDSEGKQLGYKKMLKELAEADIIMFGEQHDCPVTHWLQYELTRDLFTDSSMNMILGAEMFEADNQLILNEYLSGHITEKKFEDEARLWPNYDTDYKPLVRFALDNQLPFIATNIPRRYANMVYSGGFESLEQLSEEALAFITPLPVEYDPELKCYKDMLDMGGMGGHGSVNENFPKSQAIKDATMAHFIKIHYTDGALFIHYNGAYHSDNYQGIVWYLKQSHPELKIHTISAVRQEDVSELSEKHTGIADFILVVPESMTTTY